MGRFYLRRDCVFAENVNLLPEMFREGAYGRDLRFDVSDIICCDAVVEKRCWCPWCCFSHSRKEGTETSHPSIQPLEESFHVRLNFLTLWHQVPSSSHPVWPLRGDGGKMGSLMSRAIVNK